MNARLIALTFASIGLLLSGCATWQSDPPAEEAGYRSNGKQGPTGVGNLRRLALLALYQRPPRACSRTTDREVEISRREGSVHEIARFLESRKGYQTVMLDEGSYPAWLSGENNRDFLKEASAWSVSRVNARVGPLTTALVETVRDREKVDGLLLVHSRDLCNRANPAVRALVIIGTLGLAELYPEEGMHGMYEIHNAAIIEAATMKPVWRNSAHMGWNSFKEVFSRKTEKGLFSEALFKDLEPAIAK